MVSALDSASMQSEEVNLTSNIDARVCVDTLYTVTVVVRSSISLQVLQTLTTIYTLTIQVHV